MGRFTTLAGLVCAAGLGLATSSATAAPVTFTYTGVVTQKAVGISNFSAPWNNPAIVVGSPVTLSYTFESTAPDTDAGPVSGHFFNVTQIALTMGPASSTMNFATGKHIWVANDLIFPGFTTDRYGLFANNLPANVDQLMFQMDDTTFSTFNSDALPLTQPDPASFNFFAGQMESGGSFSTSYYRFVFNPLPEPGTVGVLMLGAVSLIRRRRDQN